MQKPDKEVQFAKPIITEFFTDKSGRPKKTPYHVTQLQTLLETNFFPWITYQAAKQLVQEGVLSRLEASSRTQERVVFFYNAKLDKPEYQKQLSKHIKAHCQLIDKYSNDNVLRILGKYLEGLVKTELRVQGFTIVETHAKKYKDKVWTKTNHNLDFIAEHHSGKLAIGVEVKNTLPIIKRDEIEVKLQICEHLQLTPVFAVRWLKPYVDMIRKRGGFSWMFKTQIYPPGFEELTKTLYSRLKLPVTVRTDLPEKTIPIFQRWVENRTK
jgi:hypothetical protein